RDGAIINDRKGAGRGEAETQGLPPIAVKTQGGFQAALDSFNEALRMALLAMNAHRMRTFLTMLGIIIGIASVVSIFALGQGARQAIINEIASSGTNTITAYPGAEAGDENASSIVTLTTTDSGALATQPYADSVTPVTDVLGELRHGNVTAQGTITGVADAYFRVRNMHLAEGRFFREDEVRTFGQVVVIDDAAAKRLFSAKEDPVGQTVLMDGVPSEVIGVLAPVTSSFFAAAGGLTVYAPYTTVMSRMLHQSNVNSIILRMKDTADTNSSMAAMERYLLVAHGGKKDFYLKSSDAVKRTIDTLTLLLSLLIGAIGGISLVVGGIGVMNIMLVSVSERTKEIGVRSAIGARRSDIMSQFIIEAVLVCLLGGFIGVTLAVSTGVIFSHFVKSFSLVYTPASIIMAFAVASLIGLGFGWLPARNASRLDPVEALARD
ncbi:MAG: Phosphonate-transporting ATPase, partial [Caulobacteraceae bacterium]|nr:Phosphonate-transporting ATPase [Caulobacteraceae bacterium]